MNIYIAGAYSNRDYRLMKWDDSILQDIPFPSDRSQVDGLTAVYAKSANEIWVGSKRKIFRSNGSRGLNPKFVDHKYSSFCSAIHNDSHSIGINTTFTPFQDFVDYSIINDFHFLIFILSKYLRNVFKFYKDNISVF